VLNHIGDNVDEANARRVSSFMDTEKCHVADIQDDDDYRSFPSSTPSSLQHIILGSQMGKARPIWRIESEHPDGAFKHFGRRFHTFLSDYLQKSLPTHAESVCTPSSFAAFDHIYLVLDCGALHSQSVLCLVRGLATMFRHPPVQSIFPRSPPLRFSDCRHRWYRKNIICKACVYVQM
jgi:hypothetical protein